MRSEVLLLFLGFFALSALAVPSGGAGDHAQSPPSAQEFRQNGKEASNPVREEQSLFPPYAFGMRREQAAALPGATVAGENQEGDILLPEAVFADLPWTVRLEFRDNALVRVSLMEIYSGKRLEAVNSALRDMGFEMLSMLVDGSSLDFISTLKTEGAAALQEKIAALHTTENPTRASYAWFETKNIRRETKIMARNLSELMQIVAADTREVEVVALGDGKGGLTHLLVDFTLPILELQTFH